MKAQADELSGQFKKARGDARRKVVDDTMHELEAMPDGHTKNVELQALHLAELKAEANAADAEFVEEGIEIEQKLRELEGLSPGPKRILKMKALKMLQLKAEAKREIAAMLEQQYQSDRADVSMKWDENEAMADLEYKAESRLMESILTAQEEAQETVAEAREKAIKGMAEGSEKADAEKSLEIAQLKAEAQTAEEEARHHDDEVEFALHRLDKVPEGGAKLLKRTALKLIQAQAEEKHREARALMAVEAALESDGSGVDQNATLVLSMDFGDLGNENSKERRTFDSAFSAEVAKALNCDPAMIVVEIVDEGSVIVKFRIKAVAGQPTPEVVMLSLTQQLNDPSSHLRSGQTSIIGNIDVERSRAWLTTDSLLVRSKMQITEIETKMEQMGDRHDKTVRLKTLTNALMKAKATAAAEEAKAEDAQVAEEMRKIENMAPGPRKLLAAKVVKIKAETKHAQAAEFQEEYQQLNQEFKDVTVEDTPEGKVLDVLQEDVMHYILAETSEDTDTDDEDELNEGIDLPSGVDFGELSVAEEDDIVSSMADGPEKEAKQKEIEEEKRKKLDALIMKLKSRGLSTEGEQKELFERLMKAVRDEKKLAKKVAARAVEGLERK